MQPCIGWDLTMHPKALNNAFWRDRASKHAQWDFQVGVCRRSTRSNYWCSGSHEPCNSNSDKVSCSNSHFSIMEAACMHTEDVSVLVWAAVAVTLSAGLSHAKHTVAFKHQSLTVAFKHQSLLCMKPSASRHARQRMTTCCADLPFPTAPARLCCSCQLPCWPSH
jgi:hypothetical protein